MFWKTKGHARVVRLAAPNAVVFSSISLWYSDSNGSSTDTADETELNTLPELLTSFFYLTAINIENSNILQLKANKCYENYLTHSTER